MKRLTLISGCALALALSLLFLGSRVPQETVAIARPPAITSTVGPAIAKAKAKPQPVTEPKRFSWHEVESDDYRQYVANLRRINVPNLTVVDIIVADVNRLFAEKATKLKNENRDSLEYKYWQVISIGTTNRAALRRVGAELEVLDRERIRLINELLGSEIKDPLVLQKPEALKTGFPTSVYSLDFLPEAKRATLKALQEAAYEELRVAIPDGATDERSRQKRKALQEKFDAERAQLLSPEEGREYDSRYSFVAQSLRSNLSGFQPTEQEFNQIVSLGKRYHNDYENPFVKDDPMRIADKLKAKREVDTQLAQALGVERFQQLQRGLDLDYGCDTRFTAELGLKQETANDLYRFREGLRQGVILNQPAFIWEQNLQAARTATLSLLGEGAYQSYTNRLDGRWLTGSPKSLAPLIISKTVLIPGR